METLIETIMDGAKKLAPSIIDKLAANLVRITISLMIFVNPICLFIQKLQGVLHLVPRDWLVTSWQPLVPREKQLFPTSCEWLLYSPLLCLLTDCCSHP